jgi:Glycosyltransferase 61
MTKFKWSRCCVQCCFVCVTYKTYFLLQFQPDFIYQTNPFESDVANKGQANSTLMGTQNAASNWTLQLLNGDQGVRRKGTVYFMSDINSTESSEPKASRTRSAPTLSQQANFAIHSISHTDSREDSFPPAATNATELEPFIAETHYNNGTNPTQQIFLGPGKPFYPKGMDTTDERNLIWPTANDTEARCTLRDKVGLVMKQAPHNFQQLIRCFSWWQMPINKGKQPVLHIERWGHLDEIKSSFGLIHAYYKAMAEAFNVRLETEQEHPQPEHVRKKEIFVNAGYGGMETSTDAYEVKDPEHAMILRNGILNHYTPNNPNRAGCPAKTANSAKAKPVIGFVDRQDSRRRLSNYQQVIDGLKGAGYGNIRYLPAMGNLTFVEQVKFMSEVDILMGPHGAQFITTLFIPECGSLLEFFPRHYYSPGWFGSLVALSGKHHFFIYNGGEGKLFKGRFTSSYAVNPFYVETIVPIMVDRWESCCAAKQQQLQQQH